MISEGGRPVVWIATSSTMSVVTDFSIPNALFTTALWLLTFAAIHLVVRHSLERHISQIITRALAGQATKTEESALLGARLIEIMRTLNDLNAKVDIIEEQVMRTNGPPAEGQSGA